MSVLVNKNTKVLVQGFTGKNGTFHSEQAIAYGTQVVGGVTPGKGGSTHLNLPVFNTMKEAVRETRSRRFGDYVPAPFVLDSIVEAVDAGIKLDRDHHRRRANIGHAEGQTLYREANRRRALRSAPNCPGIITPGECKIGIMPRPYSPTRQNRYRIALRHLDLRSSGTNHRRWFRPIDMYRYRWRPIPVPATLMPWNCSKTIRRRSHHHDW